MLIKPDVNQLSRFWVPVNLGFAHTLEMVEGTYFGEHNGIHLMAYFDEDSCMYVISELTTGYGIANGFKKWFAIEKAKRRIDTNKERVDLWIKATNAKHGALNEVISTK
ncbi:hypothetical protein [Bacillus pseudomycoides]|uniref:hypothetical protein n=1 Tax=Bacillus pseudomycoides TaxID=64104 RepID=UPI000BF4A575|nr:hypothetical protein [Bacillus pseudomycoides]PFW97663.1 hypothetical protein COL29_02460 [Bacillus pseudomycoides]